jgi:hypothetical protein
MHASSSIEHLDPDKGTPDDNAVRRMLCGEWVLQWIPQLDGTQRPRRMRFVGDTVECLEYILLKQGGFKIRYSRVTSEGTEVGEVLPA